MSWPTVQLSEVATIERKGVDPSEIASGTEYLGLEHIESGGRILGSQTVVNGELASTKFHFGPKHILYGKLRPYLAKIGMPGFDGVCSTDILPINPGPRIDRKFLAYFLRQPSMVDFATSRSTGANLPRLSPKALAEFEIPLPSLEEQKRIAAILDQADSLRRLRQRAIDRLNTLGQAIFYEMFGDPFYGVPSGEHQQIGAICEVSSGSTPSRTDERNFGGEVHWVKTGEVNGIEIVATEETVTEQGVKSARLKMYPAGTILLAMYGQGKTRGQVGLLGVPATINQACAALTCGPKILPAFLFAQLKIGYPHLRRLGQGGNQPNLNAGLVKQFKVLVPGIAEQRAFVAALDALSRITDGARKHLVANERLFASLQHKAFRGEL